MEFAFVYKARGHVGDMSGIIYAERAAFARSKLKKMGLKPKSVRIAPVQTLFGRFSRQFDQGELEQFYRYLSRLEAKGVSRSSSLSDAVNTVNDIRLKSAIAMMSDAISGSGMSLHQAMQMAGFPERDADLIRNGERAGKVNVVLAALADEIARAQGIARTIRKLLIMPVFLYFLMTAIFYGNVIFVAPRIYKVFKNVLTGIQLPEYAVQYYEFCEIFNRNVMLSTVLYAGGVLGLAVFAQSSYVRNAIELFKPIRIARHKADYAALWGTFSLMFGAGAHREDICRDLAKAAATKEARQCFGRMAKLIRDGREIDDAVALAKFPLYIVNPVVSANRSLSLVDGTKELSEKLIIDVDVFSGKAAFWVQTTLYLLVAAFVMLFAMVTIIPMLSALFSAV